MRCSICKQVVKPKGKGAHTAFHRRNGDKDPEYREDPKLPKWRLQTPVFGPGQAGIRIPAHRLKRGHKQLT